VQIRPHPQMEGFGDIGPNKLCSHQCGTKSKFLYIGEAVTMLLLRGKGITTHFVKCYLFDGTGRNTIYYCSAYPFICTPRPYQYVQNE
jgi:hypothetical protein